ncbi:MAG: gluconate 2-dehydrogenase subunit 3 family protein [Opitutae bacterium]
MNPPERPRLDRRAAIKWMLAASAAVAVSDRTLFALPAAAAPPATQGYGPDPELNREYKPGELWPLTMTASQRRTAAALCAIIIPAEGSVPSAAELGTHDFIDEWISSPYPAQQPDRDIILTGLGWINRETQRRYGKDFAELEAKQSAAVCDDLCHAPDAKPEHAEGAKFFARFRDLTASGFFTTPAGMKDIGYVGNTPLAEFKGPPRAVLEKLGLA